MTSTRTGRPLVGRDPALAVTSAALAEARAGLGGLLLVSGEAGIGKSALLAEQARQAAGHGVRVLRGTCWDGPGAPPYWVWVQVLRALDGDLAEARLLEREPAADAGPTRARFELFDAVRGALAAAAPVLVVLDDLHRVDPGARLLLEFLHRGLAAAPVLLLGAYREDEADPALRALAAGASSLPLTGLDDDGVAALMTAVADRSPEPDLVAAVRTRSGGNPLFVRELTRLMVARGDWSAAAGPIPAGVRETVRMRLARLPAPCLELLEVAAVSGAEVSPAVLAEVGPDDRTAVDDLLDAAERARVLVTVDGERRFAHDLYREGVLVELPAARRTQLHAAIATALLRLSAAGTDPAAVGGAARLAAHFVAAGPRHVDQARCWSVRAAEEATARLGHEDAAKHYTAALALADGAEQRTTLLLGLATAQAHAGNGPAALPAYRRAADLARARGDAAAVAAAALGLAALGHRSGAADPGAVDLLEEADSLLAAAGDPTALRSRVLAALSRVLRHSELGALEPRAARAAAAAVELARAGTDPGALAAALLAHHDVIWAPGATAERLAVLAEMADAAHAAGDRGLAADAVQLRAAALIERGDPEGPVELARYTRLAGRLGTATGRWAALSRRATLAQIAGRVREAVEFADSALALGTAIGLPDADGVFATLRSSLALIGGPQPSGADELPADDPMWPLRPLLRAWLQVMDGDRAGAAESLRGFSVRTVPVKHDLEMVAITAGVLAAVGTDEQREWAYHAFEPHAGLHALVGGCAAYHGAVDHHLGLLAAALGRPTDAAEHFRRAAAQHDRVGATAWAELDRAELTRLHPTGRDEFRCVDDRWQLVFAGRTAHLPDSKGLRDIATLLAAPGREVHVFDLLGRAAPATGADPVLDRTAVAAYRARLAELDEAIEDAVDPGRADRLRGEREALLHHLRSAIGLAGRPRRLGDEAERARKTVTARIRDTLRRLDQAHPPLAHHLRAHLRTGSQCAYLPDEPRTWLL